MDEEIFVYDNVPCLGVTVKCNIDHICSITFLCHKHIYSLFKNKDYVTFYRKGLYILYIYLWNKVF